MNIIGKYLFKTDAIRVAPGDSAFWYTSGKIGPYFINTHFLYGSERDASSLLDFINEEKDRPETFIKAMKERVLAFYESNSLFKEVMDSFYANIKDDDNFKAATHISGGERRDWFFSIIVSHLSGKPHLYIFKDLKVYLEEKEITALPGLKAAHIADLITQASSYDRAWIPAVEGLGGEMLFSASLVDRCQGGTELLKGKGINCYSEVVVGEEFFQAACNESIIDEAQLKLIKEFSKDPDSYGINFLKERPHFLKDSLSSDNSSTKSKAERCVNENPYNIDLEALLK